MSGKKKKSRPPLLMVLLLAAAVLLPLGSWGFLRLRDRHMLRDLDRRIRLMGELTTVTQTYRSVLYAREKKNFLQDKSMLFTVDFHVKAGVDLSEGFEIVRKDGQVILYAAPGKIFIVDGDDSSIEQIFVKERFDSVDTGDYLPLIGEEGQAVRQAALDAGILKKAEDRASLLLESILKSAGIDEAEVRFREGFR